MEIDVVIAWVDGGDPAHVEKRSQFMGPQSKGEGYVPGRWAQAGEVQFCLKSIGKYAPWVRRIWIVTDNQKPDISMLDKSLRDRIEIVDHKVIFQGHEEVLPTFNSVSIATAIHRIPGLAERYIYFNDDCMLLAECAPEDFFSGDKLVLRGSFIEAFELVGMHPRHRQNSANLVGAKPGRVFKSGHVCRPMLKSLVNQFFEANPELFERNISFRFRAADQFLVSTVVEHLAIQKGLAIIKPGKDWHMIDPGNSPKGDLGAAIHQMRKLLADGVKLGCINNFSNLANTYPPAISHLESRFATQGSSVN